MSNQANNLLSKPAIQALRLLTPAAEVHNVEKVPDFRAEYPKLFKGLGLIGQEYRIPLKQDAVPVCLYTPRRVPHPLLPKVKEKLDSMVHDNVISLTWTRLGTDLFELDRKTYLVVVDYTSRWFEVRQLHSVTASAVIRVLCELFVTHGVPDTVISDNGPQYANQEFKEFARDWGFVHVTSSPIYPPANALLFSRSRFNSKKGVKKKRYKTTPFLE